MKRIRNKFSILLPLVSLVILVSATPTIGEICLTNDEFDAIIRQFETDKKLLEESDKRWAQLRVAVPIIEYYVENKLIIQKITIPLEKDNPIEFETRFKLKRNDIKKTYTPFRLKLVGSLETTTKLDVKLGVEFFSLEPLSNEHLNSLSLNLLVGIQSTAISVCYRLPHPFPNTGIHLYTGIQNDAALGRIVGLGISLDF